MPQSLSNVILHVVFSTRDRMPLIDDEIREQLYPYVIGILRNHGCHSSQVGGIADHIHIITTLARTITIADLVKNVKGSSSSWINDNWHSKRFAWQSGYGTFSVGVQDTEAAVRYVRDQAAHHRKTTYQEEFRELMRIANIEIDERMFGIENGTPLGCGIWNVVDSQG